MTTIKADVHTPTLFMLCNTLVFSAGISNPTACGIGSFLGGAAPGIIARGFMARLPINFLAGVVLTVTEGDDCNGSLLIGLSCLLSGSGDLLALSGGLDSANQIQPSIV